MDERFTLPALAVGGVLLAIGLLWLLVVAFRTGFIKKALLPILLIVLGVAAAGFIPVYNRLNPVPPQTTKQVFGDSITITRAKAEEFPAVFAHKEWKTIQAKGAGLTDDELAGLDGMTELTTLDLNGNPITDVTLERLVKLPKLTTLFIARTKITSEGVRRHVFDNPACKLVEIDLTDLNVPGKTVRDWKNADKARRALQ